MPITQKDRSFILLILSVTIVAWLLFSSISSVATSIFRNSDNYKSITKSYENPGWVNVSENLKTKNLKNRIILLDFWTYACVNCLHMIPEIKKLEEEDEEEVEEQKEKINDLAKMIQLKQKNRNGNLHNLSKI